MWDWREFCIFVRVKKLLLAILYDERLKTLIMIQLLTRENDIIYEVAKSELFQDYRSVLREAIAYQIDLSNLFVDSECIDDVAWYGVNLTNATFINCSMKKNTFLDCVFDGLQLDNCNTSNFKIRNSTINDLHFNNCDLSSSSIVNSFVNNGLFIDCDCKKSLFLKSKIRNLAFNSSNISETFFKKCDFIEISFVHDKPSAEWINNVGFLYCSVFGCEMNHVDDVSVLYFWEVDVNEIDFKRNERFTEVMSPNTRILYAIDSDVVWWKPRLYQEEDELLFRGTLKELQYEIEHGFPTTDIYPEMEDSEIEDELLKVFVFLNLWRNEQ
jgi:hypothetical protein